MKLHELEVTEGSKAKHNRVGRGIGSGNGKTSGRGQKGQGSRSGGVKGRGFEGGQNPLARRLPKFGFTHRGHIEYATINVATLNRFEDGTVITPALLIESGLIKKEYAGVKVLAKGELTKKLTVKANKFSKTAKEAIEKVGGTVEVI